VRIAKIIEKMNCETMIGSSFGRISKKTIRQCRDHEDHVGQQRQCLVGDSARVAAADADHDRDDRGEQAGARADLQRGARAGHDLGEDVLPELRGAEPVRGRRGLPFGVAERKRVTGEEWADDRDSREEYDDARAGQEPTGPQGAHALAPILVRGSMIP
jgi:hypothetical protein